MCVAMQEECETGRCSARAEWVTLALVRIMPDETHQDSGVLVVRRPGNE